MENTVIANKDNINKNNGGIRIDQGQIEIQSEWSNMVKDTSVQIRLSNKKKAIWEKAAKKLGKSMTEFIVDLVDDSIQGEEIFERLEKNLILNINKAIDKKLK